MSNKFQKMIDKTASSPTPAKKKNSMPIIVSDDTTLDDYVKTYNEEKAKEKAAKLEKEMVEAEIIKHLTKEKDDNAFAGNFNKSYEFQTSDGKDNVKYVSADKYSINSNDEEEIKKIVGNDDNFDALFETKYNVSLKPEVFEDEDLQEELMKLIGEDKFENFFETKSALVAKDNYDENSYKVLKSQKKLDEVRVYVKQAKPSLR